MSRAQSFGYRFAMLYRLNTALYGDQIKQLGISKSQVPFIAELMFAEEGPTQDQLSERLAIDKAATARVIDQLEKDGLVKRNINPDNRRQKRVYPTQKLLDMADDLFSVLRSTGEVFVRGFTAEEKTMALDLMDRMMENALNETRGNKGYYETRNTIRN